jgi:hypothetical protein
MLIKTKFCACLLAISMVTTTVQSNFAQAATQDQTHPQSKTPTDQVKVDVHIHVDGKKVGEPVADEDRAPIDVAILLDTSNSMDGLINQARTQLWKIVQKFSTTEKNGGLPKLRVSVFEYGNTNLPASEDYIRQVLPLSDDLDKVSEALFSLKTNGGDEYCGAVIGEAVKRLDWSASADAYKAIFIAGNEPFTQGSTGYKETCAKAIQSGIVVNTIHCGDHSTGVNGMWADGARIGEGESLNINQDIKTVHIKCPQDKIIIELNTKLNSTYLWYGKADERKAMTTNQSVQDNNAASGGVSSYRIVSKAGGHYRFGNDLVDSLATNESILDDVEEDALPEEMQKLDAEGRKKFLKEKAAERAEIQKQIKELSLEREKYLASELAKKASEPGAEASFGDAILDAVNKQLSKRGFEDNSGN